MEQEPNTGEEPSRPPFPGDAFWRGIESLISAVGLGSPRTIFKLRIARARWEERRAAEQNLGRGVSFTHKACPACGRLVTRGAGRCEYCGANVRWARGPGMARTLGLMVPHGSIAMALVSMNLLFYAVSSLVSAGSTGAPLMAALFQNDVASLYNLGGLFAPAVLGGEIWRLWTYQFLHVGLLHVGFNTYALLSLGPATEDVYGPSKTATLYWLTGVAAGLTTFGYRLGSAHFPVVVGASGAIFGLIGILIGHSIRRGAAGASLRGFLIRWAVYGLVMGAAMGADNAAHLGGLAAGFLAGLVVSDRDRVSPAGRLVWAIAAVAVALLTVGGFIAAALAPRAG